MLYHVRIEGEAQGPWPLRDIVMMSGVTLDTMVCPEFDLGAWRTLESIVGSRGDTAFLFQLRTRAEQLLRMNQKLRWQLQQQTEDHRKALETEKKRTAEIQFDLERRKAQLDEVLDHNLELDASVDESRSKQESLERRLEEARRDFERGEGERKALKHRTTSLERELEDLRKLGSDAVSARAKIESLRRELEESSREIVRVAAAKEARERQFESIRSELETAERRAAESDSKFRTVSFERETADAEKNKQLEIWKLKAEKAETALEERRKTAEELKMRLEALEARAAEAESRLRSEASTSTVKGESLQRQRETLLSELDKAKLLASERAKTLDDLRVQLDGLREQAVEAENRLRVAQARFAGIEAGLREEKEIFSRQVEAEKGRRLRAEEALERAVEEHKTLEALGSAASAAQTERTAELENAIVSLKQDLIRKSHTIERLETRLQESAASAASPVFAGVPVEEADPEKTMRLPPPPEPEPELPTPEPELPTPEPELPPPPPDPVPIPTGTRSYWKLAAAVLAGAAAVGAAVLLL
ncbi:MAG: hypothetical protein CO113_11135 [Elusimicrobia bacterium CG_4_9_14_3_um_filter_62_55]|nr:MAG: hypothetical protein CO113_11135 [Elusimicrobia bacterium CG_4_9_14_3_um_filter_62_55]